LKGPHCDLIISRTNTGGFISVNRVGDAWPGPAETERVDEVHIPISVPLGGGQQHQQRSSHSGKVLVCFSHVSLGPSED